ncbi:hypothetical protein HYV88_01630 [Candidatus Woesearchaeota archaeon]|nr:hypothetical protein [Candidatus Woesearchaeota archaeon]
MRFIHKVSKGSKFNQIYIPKEMENVFGIGDIVEVRLLEKSLKLCYSKNLLKLTEFKEKLIREIFSFLSKFKEIEQIFVVGSFLIRKIEYNDIDIVVITDNKKLEETVYNKLVDRFNLKFHIISISKKNLSSLEQICPLTRSMFHYNISNKEFNLSLDKKIDKKHIEFLLMMPEDILEINVNSRVFYDNMRRLITIEGFLEGKDEDPIKVDSELKVLIGELLFNYVKNNEGLDIKELKKVREVIKMKLDKIKRLLK